VRGAVTVDDGAAFVRAAGIRVSGVAADVLLAGDSVHLRRLAARSGGPADTASLTGSVVLRPLDNPRFSLRLAARNFLAVDRARLATLWLSTPRPLTLDGPYLGATLRGAVRAERGRISIPELIDKRIVDLNEYRDVVDTTVFRNRVLLPGAPIAFVENLTVDDLSVGVGDDVWLRSPEANIKLGGALAVTGDVGRGLGSARERQLALLGTLDVERGTYRLNLGIAQPIFDVQPGTLRFFGTPDLNPTLDIRAVHTVRQARAATNRPDVQVQVNIGGTLNQPTLRLASADNPPIPDTDLISYLVTGEPAAAVLGQGAGSGDQGAAVTSIVSRLAGSVLSGALAGGPFDIVQVQTGGIGDGQRGIGESSRDILGRTRLGVGGRLDDRTFYTLSTGLCGLTGSAGDQNAFNLFANGLGVRVERRLTPTFNVELSIEPASSAQTCGQASTSRVFQQTPRQFGFDFSRAWSF
jgi:translocation and assembly module TamB